MDQLTICLEAFLAAKEGAADAQPGRVGEHGGVVESTRRTCCMSDTRGATADFPAGKLGSGRERLAGHSYGTDLRVGGGKTSTRRVDLERVALTLPRASSMSVGWLLFYTAQSVGVVGHASVAASK